MVIFRVQLRRSLRCPRRSIAHLQLASGASAIVDLATLGSHHTHLKEGATTAEERLSALPLTPEGPPDHLRQVFHECHPRTPGRPPG